MKKNNIILITFYDMDSFAIHTLHAVLKEAGFNVKSIFFKSRNINNTMDPPTAEDIAALVNLVGELNPLFVGVSFRSTFFKLAVRVTEELKKALDVLVVWGGIHPTIMPDKCIEFADVVCIGEGEGAIIDLADKISKGEAIENIRNLYVKNGEEIVKNDLRDLIQDLDTVPFPDFSAENKYYIDGGKVSPLQPPAQRTDYWIMTSRGCPFRCTYCYNNVAQDLFKGKGKYVRRRSVDNVIRELEKAKKDFVNLSYISFLDDLFTFDIKWIKEFSVRYKKTITLPFYCHIHPRFTNEEMIRLLKDAGCAGMTMGVQTGSEESRHKYFERYETNDDIVKAVQILNRNKINCVYDLIMDNPLESDINRRETFELLLKFPRPFELHIHSLTHFPGTKLTRMLLDRGLISENDVEDKKQKSYERWTPALDLERDKGNQFWDNLYYLTQKKYIPKRLIILLSRIGLLKRHPKPLTIFLRLTSFSILTIKSGSKTDLIRWYILSFLNKPYLLFKKRTWFFLWSKIKLKLPMEQHE